ncbi:MAG: hypothetical protein F4Y03_00515, partial [Alphaproteobacteria bacterium]|nr:hypothetical protein [Alphaproteobacteria bacterium]
MLYGFSSADVQQGGIQGAYVQEGENVLNAVDCLGVELEWDEAYADFRTAQRRLVALMKEEGADADLVQSVRELRSGDIHPCDLRGDAPGPLHPRLGSG